MKLTIIIPTRNRSGYVPVGLRSILDQIDSLPVDVIVSDNSDAAEATLTRQYVESLDSPAIGYIRPPHALYMVDHWSWAVDRLLETASSTHFTFLTDRGFYRQRALRDLISTVARHDRDVISFLTDTILDLVEPIVIGANNWTGAVEIVPCQVLLEQASLCCFNPALPKMLNSVVPVELAARMKAATGSFFPDAITPDYGLAFELSATLERVVFFSKPLTVGFGLRRSNGTQFELGSHDAPTAKDFMELSKRAVGDFVLNTPIPEILSSSNVIVHEFVTARARHADKRIPELSKDAYLRFLFGKVRALPEGAVKSKYLAILASHGVETTQRQGPWQRLGTLRRKLNRRKPRSFSSTEEAIRYAYEHYPLQSPV